MEALRQLCQAAKLPGMRTALGLPNLHSGQGGPAGAAFVTEGVFYPHLVGGDVGCGMTLFKTALRREDADPEQWSTIRFDLEHPWEGNVRERLENAGLCATQFAPSFGRLGGGSHFAELQAVEQVVDADAFRKLGLRENELVALVHNGSDDLGRAVLEIHLEGHGAGAVPADSDAATSYLLLHDHAVNWARESRKLIGERFVAALNGRSQPVLDACHTSISRRTDSGEAVWIHRRGAGPSDQQAVVVAGSCGTQSYLVKAIGEHAGNAWSVAHGAGRKWSRSESRQRMRERFRSGQLVRTGLGGHVICEDRNRLYEEAPMAYKNIETVIADLVEAELISVIAVLRPLLTYRTRKERR